MEKTITKRMFLENVIGVEGMSEDMVAFAKKELAILDAEKERKAITAKEKMEEREPIFAQIEDFISQTSEPVVSNEIAELLDVSIQKASSLLVMMEKAGRLSSEIVVKDKRRKKGYSVIPKEDAESDAESEPDAE